MGYQALLFCPDEKTARTVTQVLSELDFTVTPCTEPFAAVKKLMGEHFDAVVVDCDNEQNATLLFKSARNGTNNQSALAVAVVEGQAGVAKAFRIGANLVLTKPINVEQAKGTLRVARGLLRKGEAAKPTTAATSLGGNPAAPAPIPAKAAPQAAVPSLISTRAAAPIAPLATAASVSMGTSRPAAQPAIAASAPGATPGTGAKPFEASSEQISSQPVAKPAAQSSAPRVGAAVSSPAKAEPKAGIAAGQPVGSGSQASAGTAAAPAREPQPAVSSEDRTRIIPEPESAVEKVVDSAGGSSISPAVEQTSAPAPGFTFGGNVGEAKAADGKSKKMLLAVAAVVLVAAAGYEGWTQWKISGGAETGETRVAVQRAVVTPAPAPLTAPSAATTKPSFDPSSLASAPAPSSIPSSAAAAPPAGSSATVSDTELPASAASAEPRPNKAGAAADSSKAPLSVVAANKAPATAAAAQPIIIKNGLSRPSAKTAAPASEDAVPSMTGIAAAGDGGALSNLMGGASKAPTPVLQTMSISQGVSRGLLVKTVQPSYPSNALRMHIEGPVELLATISRNGDISTVKILKGDANLAHAAADAVKQWKYKPYLLNGEPVDIQTEVTVIFKLPR